jgi:hypothetical protein
VAQADAPHPCERALRRSGSARAERHEGVAVTASHARPSSAVTARLCDGDGGRDDSAPRRSTVIPFGPPLLSHAPAPTLASTPQRETTSLYEIVRPRRRSGDRSRHRWILLFTTPDVLACLFLRGAQVLPNGHPPRPTRSAGPRRWETAAATAEGVPTARSTLFGTPVAAVLVRDGPR